MTKLNRLGNLFEQVRYWEDVRHSRKVKLV
jgi:hypothetical protein